MEIRQLRPEEYDLMLENLNFVFGNARNKIVDFTKLMPKVFDGSAECTRRHYAAFDEGKLASLVGVYLMPVVIDGERFHFATVGNMITRPEYEGQGLMSKVFAYGMEMAKSLGAQAVRLGGARHRYERFQVTPAGNSYRFVISPRCVKYHMPRKSISFAPIEQKDAEAIAFARKAYENSHFYVDRGDDSGFFCSLRNYSATAFLACDAASGEKLGYVLVSPDRTQVIECHTLAEEDFWDVLAAWQLNIGKDFAIQLPGAEAEQCHLLSYRSEEFSLLPASSFAVFDYIGLARCLLALKAKNVCLPKGSLVMDIADYGKFRLSYDGSTVSAEFTQEQADVRLNQVEATRFLFGPLSPALTCSDAPALANAWLPLPLSWCDQDRG